MLSPRGYGPLYALMIFSHRVLRYRRRSCTCSRSWRTSCCSGRAGCTRSALALQLAVLLAARSPAVRPARPLLLARYYVLTTASLAAGLWDWLAHGTAAGWEPAEGTR